MTPNQLSMLPGASAPMTTSDVFQMDISDISTEQLTDNVHRTLEVDKVVALLRAKYLRGIRDRNFPITGRVGDEGDRATRKGWDAWIKKEFAGGLNVQSANREIRGLEALEAAFNADPDLETDTFGPGPAPARNLPELNQSALQEIGKSGEAAVKVARKIANREIKPNKLQIRNAVKELKKPQIPSSLQLADVVEAEVLVVDTPPPTRSPKSMASLPKAIPGKTRGSSLSRAKYGYLPDKDKQLKYLMGSKPANDQLETAVKGALEHASKRNSGKIARIQILASALHREFKTLGDRFYGAWDKDCAYPAYMTLWQHLWIEDDIFHLSAELEAVRKDIAEANHHFTTASMHLFREDVEITP